MKVKKCQITELTHGFIQQILETKEHLPLPIRAHLSKLLCPADIEKSKPKAKIRSKICNVCGFDLLNGSTVVVARNKQQKRFVSVKCMACSSSSAKVPLHPKNKNNDDKKDADAATSSMNDCCSNSFRRNSPKSCASVLYSSNLSASTVRSTPITPSNSAKSILSRRRRFARVEKLHKLAEMNQSPANDSPLNSSLSKFLLSFNK